MVRGVHAAIGHDSFKNSSQLPALLAVTARVLGVNMLSWQKSALHRFVSLDIGDRYRVALVSLGSRYQIASSSPYGLATVSNQSLRVLSPRTPNLSLSPSFLVRLSWLLFVLIYQTLRCPGSGGVLRKDRVPNVRVPRCGPSTVV